MRLQCVIPRPLKALEADGDVCFSGFLLKSEAFGSPELALAFDELAKSAGSVATKPGPVLEVSISRNPWLFSKTDMDQALREEAYRLEISPDGVSIESVSPRGAFYALKTLKTLASGGAPLKPAVVEDAPALKMRGLHVTLGSGHMPSFERMLMIIDKLAELKVNTLVLEYDDRFPWKSHPYLTHEDSYSYEQLERLIAFAESRFIEVVPLLDSLGHAEQYLCHRECERLKERPESIAEMCPQNPETLKFMKELWSEVLALHKNSRYAHITGDEVFRLQEGFCPACELYARDGRLAELFTNYYSSLSRWIIAKGKTPIIWGDMLLKHPQDLANFPRDVVVNDWCYLGRDGDFWDFKFFEKAPDGSCDEARRELFGEYWRGPSETMHPAYPTPRLFRDQGFKVLAATAVSDEAASNQPALPMLTRFNNNKCFAKAIADCGGEGLLMTFWSDRSPVEGAWFGVAAGADFSWNPREEAFPEFASRFSESFLETDGNASEKLLQADLALRSEVKSPQKTAAFESSLAKDPIAGKYLELLDVSCEMAALNCSMAAVSEKLFALMAAGSALPIALGAAANCVPGNCMPSNAPDFEFPVGRIALDGLAFEISGQCIAVGSGIPLPRPLKLGSSYDKIAVLSTCHYAQAGAMAEMEFSYEDGSRASVHLLSGSHTADWWGRGKPLRSGVCAWTGRVKEGNPISLYAGVVENPHPEMRIASLSFKPLAPTGRLVVVALCGVNSEPEALPAGVVKSLKGFPSAIEEIKLKLNRAYSGIMSPAEAKRRAEAALRPFEATLAASNAMLTELAAESSRSGRQALAGA